jgi:hypothetical protein
MRGGAKSNLGTLKSCAMVITGAALLTSRPSCQRWTQVVVMNAYTR